MKTLLGPRSARFRKDAATCWTLALLTLPALAQSDVVEPIFSSTRAAAVYALAMSYRGLDGRRLDQELAFKHLQRAAELGHGAAQSDLAFLFFNGSEGVPRDRAQSFRWFNKAAEGGEVRARCMIGDFYKLGLGGAPVEPVQALKWYRIAAQSDDRCAPKAQFELYRAYESGWGVPLDLTRATQWLQRAAEGRHPRAQFILGRNYASGHGVEKNSERSAYWLRKSREGVSPHDDHDFGDTDEHAADYCAQHPQGHAQVNGLATFARPLVIPKTVRP